MHFFYVVVTLCQYSLDGAVNGVAVAADGRGQDVL